MKEPFQFIVFSIQLFAPILDRGQGPIHSFCH